MDQKESKKQTSYKIEDAMKIADEILKLSSEKKYNVGAFIHGLIFAQEYVLHTYKIPQQQIAMIKRDCRKYFNGIEDARKKQIIFFKNLFHSICNYICS